MGEWGVEAELTDEVFLNVKRRMRGRGVKKMGEKNKGKDSVK